MNERVRKPPKSYNLVMVISHPFLLRVMGDGFIVGSTFFVDDMVSDMYIKYDHSIPMIKIISPKFTQHKFKVERIINT